MKRVPTIAGTLAGVALLAAITWAAQDAGNGKPQQPKGKAPAAAPQNTGKDKPAAPAKPQDAGAEKPKGKTGADGKPVEVDADAALTARYTKAAATGDEHKWLASLAGKWKTVTKQMIKPNSATVESTGTSEFKMLMDGRFLIESNSSAGGPGNSSGMGIVGFNNMTGKYERVWFDTHSTAMVKSEGEFNKDREEIRWTDSYTDPGSGQVITTESSMRKLNDKEMAFTQVVEAPNKTKFVALSMQYRKD